MSLELTYENFMNFPSIKRHLDDGYEFEALHIWRKDTGDPLFYVIRLSHHEKTKIIYPAMLKGTDIVLRRPPKSNILYNLHELSNACKRVVYVVEGEKSADALNDFFKNESIDAIATTSGSSNSANRADWSPLRGRKVTLWPDNDEAGLEYALEAKKQLSKVGVSDCSIINPEKLDLPLKGDAFDWLNDNLDATEQDLLALPLLTHSERLKYSGINLTCIDDVEMMPVKWLWENTIACGKITTMAGNPGLGKSQITSSFSAIITNGWAWPCGDKKSVKGQVIILSAEDDVADTIKPRLMASGADVKKCHVIETVKDKDGKRLFNLTDDLDKLSDTLEMLEDVKLVIIDPISAYLGDTDENSNASMRVVMARLKDMAEHHDTAFLLVTHCNKSSAPFMQRILGSIALVGASRACYAIVKDKNEPDDRYFLPVKNNIGDDKTGYQYKIVSYEAGINIHTSKVEWHHESTDKTIEDFEGDYNGGSGKNTTIEWLEEYFDTVKDQKEIKSLDVCAEGIEAGFSKDMLRRAYRKMGYKPIKEKGVKDGAWVWENPCYRPVISCNGKVVGKSEDRED